jgi:hypothetical protein
MNFAQHYMATADATAANRNRNPIAKRANNGMTKANSSMRSGASGELVRSFCAVTDRMEKTEFGFLTNASKRLQVVESTKATVCRYSKKGRRGFFSKNDVLENRGSPSRVRLQNRTFGIGF